ncbi:hypothetical protein NEUTE1DRAFT_111412 [Neurospora tetrasperma FGSC 2508]|uniref:Uncharacterized protein n=1 Tax=Neurospora tetrasperma (strain FGSC 2508 / ATCC MYA-4615 / P0657) TaxID=510951 RepID=F8MNY1_NEUT8|nr:uncharacterized protein NEUTE1DRAFT_111412 [Neurospora tetrasperma FGSC 2508]EGO57046.1 hypothetical protein NEUTE1DRAFT_111412 [Neurospora tetrasperma FGSC 2508]
MTNKNAPKDTQMPEYVSLQLFRWSSTKLTLCLILRGFSFLDPRLVPVAVTAPDRDSVHTHRRNRHPDAHQFLGFLNTKRGGGGGPAVKSNLVTYLQKMLPLTTSVTGTKSKRSTVVVQYSLALQAINQTENCLEIEFKRRDKDWTLGCVRMRTVNYRTT